MIKKLYCFIVGLFKKSKPITSDQKLSVSEIDKNNQIETEAWLLELVSKAKSLLSPDRVNVVQQSYHQYLRQTRELVAPQESYDVLKLNARFRNQTVSCLAELLDRLRKSQFEEAVVGTGVIPNGTHVIVKQINCRGVIEGQEAGFDNRPQYIIRLNDEDRKNKVINDKYGFAYYRGLEIITREQHDNHSL